MSLNSASKIAVFTSIRSEYGLLKPILRKLRDDSRFQLRLLVGGAHFSENFGYTIDEIRNDKFSIAKELPFLVEDGKPSALVRSLAILQHEIGLWLAEDRPDFLMILGDRFELLPVVTAALIEGVPIAHISGGEVTEGAIDNQVRHAITKMAHLHFPANEFYKSNLIKMGEEEWRICVSGEPGLDDILSMEYFSREELYQELSLPLDKPVMCVTFHSETIHNQITPDFVTNLLSEICRQNNFHILATAANFDHCGLEINKELELLSGKFTNFTYRKSLGKKRYYSLMRYAQCMIGNSSSGIVEAQSFGLPVLNVGKRQQGRLANPNVLNVEADISAVMQAIPLVMSDNFKTNHIGKKNIYGNGDASTKILDFIFETKHRDLLLKRDRL